MPNFNQRGPVNEGPMTGRGNGTCARGTAQDMGRGSGRRCGMGPGQGRRRARNMAPDALAETIAPNLLSRIHALESELAALKGAQSSPG